MKKQYVSSLGEGLAVDSAFVLRSKELRVARTGEAYLHLEIGDRTGSIPAVRFRPDPNELSAPVGVVVHVRGRVTAYRGRQRVSIERMRPAEMYEREDMLPGRRSDAAEAKRSLRRCVSGVRDGGLRGLLSAVFGDELFLSRFLDCPMSSAVHRAYVGGLAEHTLAVAALCATLARSYPELHRDLLITAALLHDVGVVDELRFDTSIEVTDAGRLLGHELLAVRRIEEAAARGRVRPLAEQLAAISHAVLTHEAAPGSTSRGPRTLEAVLLNAANAIDVTATGFARATAAASAADERWTDDRNVFGRSLFVSHAECVVSSATGL